MRVLHLVSSSQLRGAEMFARDLDAALADQGIDQRVALLRASASGPQVCFRSPTESLGAGRGLAPGLRLDLGALSSLRRLIAGWKPDLVQAHGGEALKYAIPARGGRAGVVYRRIGSTPDWMAGRMRRAGHRALIRRAERVVAVAAAVRVETIHRFALDPARVVTIPNGVDLDRAMPRTPRSKTRARLGIEASARVAISVGAFTEEKDPEAQIEIARRVIGRRPGTVFLLVGEGPLAGAARREVARTGLDDSIRLLGPCPEVPDLLAASDVMLLASRTEGMPAVLIEAGVAGLPAAAYALSGVPEIVEDGKTGLLAPPGDLEALAARLLTLLDDEEGRVAMGRAAREVCAERFDIRAIARRYLDVYQEIIGTPAGATR